MRISQRLPRTVPAANSPGGSAGAGARVAEIDQPSGVAGVFVATNVPSVSSRFAAGADSLGVSDLEVGPAGCFGGSSLMNVASETGVGLPHFLQAAAAGGFSALQ
jgi:hypothetical protein